MDKKYWDKLAKSYEEEIFSSLDSDMRGVIRKRINKFASKSVAAADFGCGIGLYIPLLAASFKHVYAMDLSRQLVDKAIKKYAKYKNVDFSQADLAKKKPLNRPVKFGICTNVLIAESQVIRDKILKNISACVAKGGCMVFVVPSHESSLYVNCRLFEWNLNTGVSRKQAIEDGLRSTHKRKGSVCHGLINIDNVTTKHYLKEELEVMLPKYGFTGLEFEKVEYGWDTEFESPPKWMKEPFPWDWMITAVKK